MAIPVLNNTMKRVGATENDGQRNPKHEQKQRLQLM